MKRQLRFLALPGFVPLSKMVQAFARQENSNIYDYDKVLAVINRLHKLMTAYPGMNNKSGTLCLSVNYVKSIT